jgi:two-component system, chemotaxis family, protein-glutamate methylesterase/glutaminase
MTPGFPSQATAPVDRSSRPSRILVVDDSAVVRQAMIAILTKGGFTVDIAADPLIALEKMKKARPDVIVLDLEMPRMDGLTFLRKVMTENPIPVVVCSGLTGSGTEAAVRALEEGAVEIITKPRVGVHGFLVDSAAQIVDAILGAARARLRVPRAQNTQPRLTADAMLPLRIAPLAVTTDRIVVIGASTGGTEALRRLLQDLPPDCPGLVIVQHMPEVFTAAFARRLNETCRIEVREAADGDHVVEGRALIAPGNRHTLLRRSGARYAVEVADGPLVSRHRPSVDVLFRSAAQAAGVNAVGVILTGMGNDGADGLLEMKRAGARTLAQDEATCVVFGMPREAIARGAADDVLPLGLIPAAIVKAARSDLQS